MTAGSHKNEEERVGGWRHQRGRGRKNEINIQRSADGGAEMRCEKKAKIGEERKENRQNRDEERNRC